MYSKFKKFTSFCLCSLSGLLLGAFLISLTYLIAMKYHTYLKLAPRLVIWNLAAIAVLYFLTHCLLRALNFTGLNLSVKFAEMKPIKIFSFALSFSLIVSLVTESLVMASLFFPLFSQNITANIVQCISLAIPFAAYILLKKFYVSEKIKDEALC